MMRFYICILSCILLFFSCSTSDVEYEESVRIYTMKISVDADPESRVSYEEISKSLHCYWEIGDKVILANTLNQSFNFTVTNVYNDGSATLAYEGYIPNATHFTGTATYSMNEPDKANIQRANGNTEHIKYGELLQATLSDQKIDGATLHFSHQANVVYKVTFKAPEAIKKGSTLTMSGAWADDATLSLDFEAAKDDDIVAYIVHKEGEIKRDEELKFTLNTTSGTLYSFTYTCPKDYIFVIGQYNIVNIGDKLTEQQLIEDHEYVDLGLPSGTKWATCNVGASCPEEYGDYFAWGETVTKAYYNNSNSSTYGKSVLYLKISDIIDSNYNLAKDYDAASKNWGGSWRMPTFDEIEELMDESNCLWVWTSHNGVYGRKITSKRNGNSIFLPAAGYRGGTALGIAGSDGFYWSATADDTSSYSCYLYIGSSLFDWDYTGNRYYGKTIRPVFTE